MAELPVNGNLITSWAKAIATIGTTSVIALFLVYVSATEMPKLSAMVNDTRKQADANRDLLREHMAQNDELLRLMRWICVGVSKDDNDRRQCFAK